MTLREFHAALGDLIAEYQADPQRTLYIDLPIYVETPKTIRYSNYFPLDTANVVLKTVKDRFTVARHKMLVIVPAAPIVG